MSSRGRASEKRGSTFYLILLSYAALYIVWGSTYLFIKLAVQTIAPLYVVGLRFFTGGLIFVLFSLVTGRIKRLPTYRELAAALFLGSLLLLGGNGMVTFAERKVDSYLTALILSTTPVVVGFFDRLFLKKKLSFFRSAGILLGVVGVGVLLYDGGNHGIQITPEILLVIGGLTSWSLATSLGHRIGVYPDAVVNSGLQMLFVGVLSLGTLLFTKPPTMAMISACTPVSIAAVLYLAVFGSLTFLAYTFLIRHEPAIRVVSYAFVNPVIAILLGIVVAREITKPLLVPGTALILVGLFAMLYGDALWRRRRLVPLQ